jgi:hypothetical protein
MSTIAWRIVSAEKHHARRWPSTPGRKSWFDHFSPEV